MSEMSPEFKLVCEYFTPAPIRSLTQSAAGEFIFSGGEDACARKFTVKQQSGEVEPCDVVIQHNHWVTALTSLAPGGAIYPDGCIVTGCRDGVIRVYSLDGAQLMQLQGHSGGVTSFSWLDAGKLISGSWDGTARVWDLSSGVESLTLSGHENGVSVLALPDGVIATASTGEKVGDLPANFKLRLWASVSGKQILETEDHLGPIRGLAAIPGVGFISCSNDGTVKLRACDGAECATVCHDPQEDGSAPLILACAGLCSAGRSDAEYASVGEDGSCYIWRGSERLQSLPHPNTVWCVCPLTNGDFATGSEDGVLRIFSRDVSRQTTAGAEEKTVKLAEDVAAARTQRTQRSGPSAEEVASYPRWEDAAALPGTKPGDVKVFNKGGVAIAAQWDANSACWIEVGEVTGQSGAAREEIDGVAYDFVLPVEMESTSLGIVSYKLGYNTGENPFVAAQRFLDANGMPQYHLQQVADFITQNTGAASAGPTFDLSTPAAAAASAAPSNGANNGYMGTAAPAASSSSSSAPSSLSTPEPASVFRFFPLNYYFTFDDVPSTLTSKVLPKYLELHSTSLSSSETDAVKQLVETLGATSHYHSTRISKAQLAALVKPLSAGAAPDSLYPIFDLLRIASLHPEGSTAMCNGGRTSVLETVLTKAETLLLLGSACPSSSALTCTRMLCNLVKRDEATAYIHELNRFPSVLRAVLSQAESSHKLVRAAVTTFVANVVYLKQQSSQTPGLSVTDMTAAVHTLVALVASEEQSTDVIVRAALVLGTLALTHALPSCAVSPGTTLKAARARWGDRLGAGMACVDEAMGIVGST